MPTGHRTPMVSCDVMISLNMIQPLHAATITHVCTSICLHVYVVYCRFDDNSSMYIVLCLMSERAWYEVLVHVHVHVYFLLKFAQGQHAEY